MPREKDINSGCRKAMRNLEKSYKPICKLFRPLCSATENIPDSCQSSLEWAFQQIHFQGSRVNRKKAEKKHTSLRVSGSSQGHPSLQSQSDCPQCPCCSHDNPTASRTLRSSEWTWSNLRVLSLWSILTTLVTLDPVMDEPVLPILTLHRVGEALHSLPELLDGFPESSPLSMPSPNSSHTSYRGCSLLAQLVPVSWFFGRTS